MTVHLTIKPVQLPSNAAEFTFDAEPSITVAELKEQIAERVGLSKDDIRLVCAGRIWQDVSTVATYEPQDGAVVHCLNNAPRPSSASQPQGGAGAAAATPAAAMPAPAAPAAGGDPFQQMMAQAHQMMQNPQVLQQLMNTPMVQQMFSDPETVRAMLRMNPQLSRLMEQRPEIARLLDDPEVLQQSMRFATNPSLMREMTRNADRAIGQLDAMPGGHDALLRAHSDFADPLYEALSGGGNPGNEGGASVPTYTQPTEGGPNSSALPNPWGAPQPAPSPTAAAPAAPTPAPGMQAGGMDPLMAMLGGQPPVPAGGQAPAAQANPMASMMQQMMSDPAQMQQMMAMTRQMMQPQGAAAQATTPPAAANPLAPNPFLPPMLPAQQPAAQAPAANPFAAMMQQMMADPQQMQQMMNMTQQMFGGGMPGMGAPFTPAAPTAPAAAPVAPATPAPAVAAAVPQPEGAAPGDLALQRMRFASQLSQLMAMGFTNEAACLRALAQHGGRVDAAIDTLLSSPPDGN